MKNLTLSEAWSLAWSWCRWKTIIQVFSETYHAFTTSFPLITTWAILPSILGGLFILFQIGGTAHHTIKVFSYLLFVVTTNLVSIITIMSAYAPSKKLNILQVTIYTLLALALSPSSFMATLPTLVYHMTTSGSSLILVMLHTSKKYGVFKRLWLALKTLVWNAVYFLPFFFAVSLVALPLVTTATMALMLAAKHQLTWFANLYSSEYPKLMIDFYIVSATAGGIFVSKVIELFSFSLTATILRKIYKATGQESEIK